MSDVFFLIDVFLTIILLSFIGTCSERKNISENIANRMTFVEYAFDKDILAEMFCSFALCMFIHISFPYVTGWWKLVFDLGFLLAVYSNVMAGDWEMIDSFRVEAEND